jgi:hypothetical protein
VAHKQLPLLDGIRLHRVAGESLPEQHPYILTSAMKSSGITADIAIK